MPVKPESPSKLLNPGQSHNICKQNQSGYIVEIQSTAGSFTVKYDQDFTITRVTEKVEWLANYEIDSSKKPVQYHLILKPLTTGSYVILKENSSTPEPLTIKDKKGSWMSAELDLDDPAIGIK
jgi:hypothetical protein